MIYRYIPVLLALLLATNFCQAQDWKALDADVLFARARQEAFNENRVLAREMLHHILETSPDYHDVRVFLGRTYAWDGQRDSARSEFKQVLAKSPEHLEALQAYTDVEIWDEKFETALSMVDRGLKTYPTDEELLYKRASILNSLGRQSDSQITLSKLLDINPSHENGKKLLRTIKVARMKYTAGISYNIDLFDKVFNPAHAGSVQLGRTNSWGTAIMRMNWAHRFETNGFQPEIEAYPSIVKGVYAYLNYGYSNTLLFPKHRIGAEIFTKLPGSLEASAGIRYLHFNAETEVNIYTASLGWYVKDYLLLLRGFVTPDEEAGTSVSGSLTARRYFSDADTYVGLVAGIGFSPDIRRIQSANGLSSDQIFLLGTQRFGIVFQKSVRTDLILNASVDFNRQELIFDEGEYVFITGVGLGLRKRF